MATATSIPESINDEVVKNRIDLEKNFKSKFSQIKQESVREISKLANEYGSDFVNIFYKTLDQKRHVNLDFY